MTKKHFPRIQFNFPTSTGFPQDPSPEQMGKGVGAEHREVRVQVHAPWSARCKGQPPGKCRSPGQRREGPSSHLGPHTRWCSPHQHWTSGTSHGRKMQERKRGEPCQEAEKKWGVLSGESAGRTSGRPWVQLLLMGLKISPPDTLHGMNIIFPFSPLGKGDAQPKVTKPCAPRSRPLSQR